MLVGVAVEPLVVAIIAAFAPTLAVLVGYLSTRRRVEQVHVLVNARLTEALNRIEELEARYEPKEP